MENTIKTNLKEIDLRMRTRFIWITIRSKKDGEFLN